MKLEEYKELKTEETINALRKPKEVNSSNFFQLMAKKVILNQIINLLTHDGAVDNYNEYLLASGFLKSLCGLVGSGSLEDPYRISTEFGNGGFMDLYRFFPDGKIPEYIQNNSCHRNCYYFALSQVENCEIITGIYQKDKDAHLHSVIGVNGIVLDFNWKIVMSEELYFKLFNFEVINRLPSWKVKENNELVANEGPMVIEDLTYAETNACFDEVLDYIKTHTKSNNV